MTLPIGDRAAPASRILEITRSSETPRTAISPVYRASTIFFDDMDQHDATVARAMAGERGSSHYGTVGTPTTFALTRALEEIEGAGHDCRAVLLPSGKHAIVAMLLAFLKAGDHLLMADSVYGPARIFAESELPRFGITAEFFDPLIDAEGIEALIRPETRLIYMESPGTHTFDISDVPAIAAVARAKGVLTAVDNGWGSPMHGKPFDWGADISLLPLTKFWNGHSDVVMGAIVVRAPIWDRLWRHVQRSGPSVSGDDAYLVLRGARTMALRLSQHERTGVDLAQWLERQPGIASVRHPALPSHPQHALWQRDFKGSCGLFSIELDPTGDPERDALRARALCEGRRFFRIGGSWGGVDSMIVPAHFTRTVRHWTGGKLVRLFAGLEDVEDLRQDLAEGLAAIADL